MAKRVVILGAGITGLSAGWLLASQYGMQPTIVEKLPYVGGICASRPVDGAMLDFGPHRFQTREDWIRKFFFDALDGNARTVREKNIAIHFKGALLKYPLDVRDAWSSLPLKDVVRFGLSKLGQAMSGSEGAADLASFLVSKQGRVVFEELSGPFAEKLWGMPCSKLDAQIEKQRVVLLTIKGLLASLFGSSEKAYKEYQSVFYYPEAGNIGAFPEALAKKIEAMDGRIVVSQTARKIEHSNGKATAVVLEDGERIECDFVLSTIPLHDLFSTLGADDRMCRDLRYRSLWFHNLKIRKQRLSKNHMIYFPSPDLPFHRIGEQKNFHPDVLEKGATWVGAEVGFFADEAPDPVASAEQTVEKLAGVFSLASQDVQHGSTFTQTHAYPLYELGFRKNVDRALSELAGFSNILSNGRQGLFRLNNMDHAIEMGRAAAEQIGNPQGEWGNVIRRFDSFKIVD